MISVLDVRSDNGVPFRVLFIPPGELSPNFPSDVASKVGSVEVYDRRHPHTPDGQFTGGRYYLDTLLQHPRTRGLDVHGGVPDWTIDGATFGLVRLWLGGFS